MDLASFASVKNAAQNVLASSSRLDILITNAGIMATPAATTEDGYEIQIGTNHMGHALLTKLLLPLLEQTANEPNSEQRRPNYQPKFLRPYSMPKRRLASFRSQISYGLYKHMGPLRSI
jgi:NAD(P)-dependent dehydrogenase (short-subunit alcohol dehydrogenase family)